MKIITALVCTLLTLPAYSKSPLWQVSKGDDTLYIGGTVHVLSSSDFPLPSAFDEAYNNSETVVLETDMQRMKSPTVQAMIASKMSYTDGSTLKAHLKPATYAALEAYLEKTGIPAITFSGFKPAMVSMMLTMMELRKLGISGAGVDQFFASKATDDHKTLGKLETVEQQINFLAKMGESDPDEFMLYTLKDLASLEEGFNAIKQAWRNGDTDKLAELAITPLKKFPDAYDSLIVKRNKAWVPQIEEMLKTKEVEMVLVGALHLAGDDSVLKQLEALGYKVEQF